MSLRRVRPLGTIAYMGGIMSVPEPFTFSLFQLALFSQAALCSDGEYINGDHATMSLHDSARNELAGRMKGDWLLMFDTDMEFEPDTCARLVTAMYRHDLDVVTGLYSYKGPPHLPIAYCFNEETQLHEIVGDWDHSLEMFQVSSSGGGCLLVRLRVFERIVRELAENPFARIGSLGEDHSFHRRLRKLGIKAFCAWKIETGHLAYHSIRPSRDYTPPPKDKYLHVFDMEGIPAETYKLPEVPQPTGERKDCL
jgi:hypothetical protein